MPPANMIASADAAFARALRGGGLPPSGLTDESAHRFAVYRNNVAVCWIEALEARFPAVRVAVGGEYFNAMAHAFCADHPPSLPMLSLYGEDFPDFIRSFAPAAEIPYLADLATIDRCRTHAVYAADVEPLPRETLASLTPEMLMHLRVDLHPSVAVVASIYPIVTIWAMNMGEMPVAPVTDWSPESALIARPWREVEVRRLPPGGAGFLAALADGCGLVAAAQTAAAAVPNFDLGVNLAGLFDCGLAIRLDCEA